MQLPFFEALGIPLGDYFLGTINVDISPLSMTVLGWDYEARNITWTKLIPPEDFLFSRCKMMRGSMMENTLIYHPSPETKVENFHNPHIIEILSPHQKGLEYGDSVILYLNPNHCSIT